MIDVSFVDQLVPHLFQNQEFLHLLKDTFSGIHSPVSPLQSTSTGLKPISRAGQNYNKSVATAIEQIYGDVYEIIRFNLSQSINAEFNDLAKEVVLIKKEVLGLDVSWQNKIKEIGEKVKSLQGSVENIQRKTGVESIQQQVKEKIGSARSMLKKYQDKVGQREGFKYAKEDFQSRVSHQPEIVAEPEGVREEFEAFKKSLKKSNEFRFESIWKVIISIRQTLHEILPPSMNPEQQWLSTDASYPQDPQKQVAKEKQFLKMIT